MISLKSLILCHSYTFIYIELETLQSVLLPSLDENSVTIDENTSPSKNTNNSEINQLETILNKLKHEQELSNANVIQKEKRIQEMKVDSNIISIVNTSNNNTTNNDSHTHQVDVLSRQIDAHKKNISLLNVQNNELSELYEGIKSLNGIKLFEVTEARHNTSDAAIGIDIRIIIHECEAIFSLDQNNTLCDIQIISTKNSLSHVDINSILQEASTLPAPQDLRYAVFSLKAAQTSTTILQTHISALRKICIVKLTGPLSLQITLNNGLTLLVSVHECYPEIPGAVHVDSMYGIGGWSADECTVMKAISNSKCFSNIVDLVDSIMSYVK